MKILAPLVLTIGLSFALYNTKEVWPKQDYEARSQAMARGAPGTTFVPPMGGDPAREMLDRRFGNVPQFAKDAGGHSGQFQYPAGDQGKTLDNPINIGGNR